MRSPRRFLCVDCEHTWTTPYRSERPEACPRCGSPCFGRLTWIREDDPQQERGARHGMGVWRLGGGPRGDRHAE
jgi:hypothetical protein